MSKTVDVKLYKLKRDLDDRLSLINLDLDDMQDYIGGIKKHFKDYYTPVYQGTLADDKNVNTILNQCTNLFTVNRPNDFSDKLEFSDIIVLDNNLRDNCYFYDPYGWQEVV